LKEHLQFESNYWFRPKRYGYGLTPISWQGWVATLILLGILWMAAYTHGLFDANPIPTSRAICNFMIDLITLSGLFLVLMKDKTQGEIKWNWGG